MDQHSRRGRPDVHWAGSRVARPGVRSAAGADDIGKPVRCDVRADPTGSGSGQPAGRTSHWGLTSGTFIPLTIGFMQGRAPGSGVRAVGKWPAVATVKSLAEAGHLSTAVVIADLR